MLETLKLLEKQQTRLGTDFREAHEEIEWNRIRGFRNRIVHHYFGIDYEIVWSIIKNDLDDLKNQLINLLNNE